MSKELIAVDKNCLYNGVKQSINGCPVALGLREKYYNVQVASTKIGFGPPDKRQEFENSWDLRKWILAFDAGEKVDEIIIALDFNSGMAFIAEEA